MSTFDLAIIGGGPAGAAASVYAARKQLKTVLITESFGGQSVESAEIQNWIGTPKISGPNLAKALEQHVREYADSWIAIEKSRVKHVEKTVEGFRIAAGKNFDAKTVLVASGGARKKLTVPGAIEFENKGVVYCASCDGPLFADQNVVVVGGGNAAFESAAQLLAYCKSVTLVHRSAQFKADPVTVEKVLAHPHMTALKDTTPIEIKGSKFVESVVVRGATGDPMEIPATGIFVEIGMMPNTGFLGSLVALDEINRIKIDPTNQRTSHDGVWAAGDCTSILYHQNNIAAGDAVKALEDIYLYLRA